MPNTKTTQTPARGRKSSQKRGKAPTTDQFCFLVASNLKISIEKEYQFYAKRKWRFDYAIPEYKIAIEVEGGVWTRGRHTRGVGFMGDMVKYNAAAVFGWRLLRVVPDTLMTDRTLRLIRACIENQKNLPE